MSIPILRSRTFVMAASVAVGFAALASTGPLCAGPAFYIFDLGLAPGAPGIGSSHARGISNLDAEGNFLVVGQSSSSAPSSHAFVWLWKSGFDGLNHFVMHDLNTLTGQSSNQSLAHKVNRHGQAVGWFRVSNIRQPHAWDLEGVGGPTATHLNPPGVEVSGTEVDTIGAHDISDADPAWVVGATMIEQNPAGPSEACDNIDMHRGFRCRPDGTSMTVLALPPQTFTNEGLLLNVHSWGFGVNASGAVVGAAKPCTAGSPTSFGCFSPRDPAHWSVPATGAEQNSLPLYSEPDGDHNIYSINASGNMVGSGWSLPSYDPPIGPGLVCLEHAGFWESAGAFPVNLGTFGGIDIAWQTIAWSANDPPGDSLQVVGEIRTVNQAVLWERDASGTWNPNVRNLTDEVPAPTGWTAADNGVLAVAYDINDAGYIVGAGRRYGHLRAYLLDPIETCWADFVGELGGPPDCKVKGEDLASLLGAWGSNGCGGSKPCYPDLDQDGDVDGFDLALLNGVWTGDDFCEECAGALSFSGGSGGSPPTLQEAVAALIALGEIDLAAFLVEVWPEE